MEKNEKRIACGYGTKYPDVIAKFEAIWGFQLILFKEGKPLTYKKDSAIIEQAVEESKSKDFTYEWQQDEWIVSRCVSLDPAYTAETKYAKVWHDNPNIKRRKRRIEI